MSDRSPTLDQLRTFLAVAEAGSFSAAAEMLDKAQSVVSYTIANLEGQLGCALFERARRKPVLTEAGRAMLADARRIDLMTRAMTARAVGMTGGLEGEVSLAVDVLYPSAKLVAVLQAFAKQFPTVALKLQMEALGGVLRLILDGESELGISGPRESWPDPIEAVGAGSVRLEAVAAPCHPLAQIKGPLRMSALREHTQLVLSDRSKMTAGRDFGVYGAQTWRLGDLDAKHRLLLAGLGWGSMPEHIVANDIAEGTLVRLSQRDRAYAIYPFSLIHRVDARSGPATQWLVERFAAMASGSAPADSETFVRKRRKLG
ncbi:MAG TPA: LysR family transcriptional regulator [Pararobbsia sp.]|nr:LysR family transcriptional regulator [Pararobbsia sp.]